MIFVRRRQSAIEAGTETARHSAPLLRCLHQRRSYRVGFEQPMSARGNIGQLFQEPGSRKQPICLCSIRHPMRRSGRFRHSSRGTKSQGTLASISTARAFRKRFSGDIVLRRCSDCRTMPPRVPTAPSRTFKAATAGLSSRAMTSAGRLRDQHACEFANRV